MTDLIASLKEAAKKFSDPHTTSRDMAVPLRRVHVYSSYQLMREELMTDVYGEVYGHWYVEALDKIDLEETLINA